MTATNIDSVSMQSVFGQGYRIERRSGTDNPYIFLLSVNTYQDLVEGKQLVRVTAQGPWSIAFEFQQPEPAPSASPAISGTGVTTDTVVLEQGSYIVTATNIDSVSMQSVFGQGYRIERRSGTDNPYIFLLSVNTYQDLVEGKQLVRVTAQGPWSIAFEFQQPEPAPSASPAISGTGDTTDTVVLEQSTYIVTATNIDSVSMQSVFGQGYRIERRSGTDNPYIFLLSVNTYQDLVEGKQLVKVSAQGPWSISFDIQEREPAPSANPTLSGTVDTVDTVTLESGSYIVTATNIDSVSMQSVFGQGYRIERRSGTDNPYIFLLSVNTYQDLVEGKQLVRVTAQGSWSITFEQQ